MLVLVDLLENFARSGAKYLLLGSFEELAVADPSISTGSGTSKESDQDDSSKQDVVREGVPYSVSLQQEPFGLEAPLQIFPEPEGFGAGFDDTSGNTAAKTGEGAKLDVGNAKSGTKAKSGIGAKSGERARPAKNAARDEDVKYSAVNRQMLLYSGDYLRRQDFFLMRGRVELFLDAK